jgi:hypothetical protein
MIGRMIIIQIKNGIKYQYHDKGCGGNYCDIDLTTRGSINIVIIKTENSYNQNKIMIRRREDQSLGGEMV